VSTTTVAPAPVREDIIAIPIGKIKPCTLNPRKTFNQEELEGLAKSFKSVGLLQPILVRPKGDDFEIVAGERRWRAAQLAELTELDAKVKSLTDAQVLDIAIIENAQRVDVHPLEEGEGYKARLAIGDITTAELAEKVGKSVSHINRRVQMCNLIDEAKDAFIAGQISIAHVRHMLPLPPAAQKDAITYLCYETVWKNNKEVRGNKRAGLSNVSPVTFADYIRKHFNFILAEAPFDLTDAELLPKAGACNLCVKRSGASSHLFADEKPGPDTCLDNQCFRTKIVAHLDKRRLELEGLGEKVFYLTDEWARNEKESGRHWLGNYYYNVSENGPHIGLCYSVRNQPIGKELRIRYTPPQQHGSNTQAKSKEQVDYEAKREKYKVQLGKDFRDRIKLAIDDNLPKQMSLDAVRALAAGSFSYDIDSQRLAKIMNLTEKDYASLSGKEAYEILQRWIAEADEAQLIRAMCYHKVAYELYPGWEDSNKDLQLPRLRALLKTLGVDADGLLAALRAENPAPEKPKPPKKDDKPKAKGKAAAK
jgi:ParB/RepB/Spo0J family partition protein